MNLESDTTLRERILYLLEIEKLSRNEVMRQLKVGARRLKRLLLGAVNPVRPKKPSELEAYRALIDGWYAQYPRLQASAIHRRLRGYGYKGSVSSVERFTQVFRIKKHPTYHELVFVPGEEAQVDWFFTRLDNLGYSALFLYVLSHSRYAWGKFYPRCSFEFFLSGHQEVFHHLNGLARTGRYDNLKSVVLKHTPLQIDYNPQFLEFARHYGFKIHACNPYKGNEKGRVERVGRDVRESFLYGQTFKDYGDINSKFIQWLGARNKRVHSSTGKTPLELLTTEKLLPLPAAGFNPSRTVQAVTSKTALVAFETNRYSVPSSLSLKPCQILAYPEKVEILVSGKTVARHKRSFKKLKIIQNPLHAEALLNKSPLFKLRRILQLVDSMDQSFHGFLSAQEDDADKCQCAYEIFKLLRTHGKAVIVSAVRELVSMKTYKIKSLMSMLGLMRQNRESAELFPTDRSLLDIRYQERSLEEYDPD